MDSKALNLLGKVKNALERRGGEYKILHNHKIEVIFYIILSLARKNKYSMETSNDHFNVLP